MSTDTVAVVAAAVAGLGVVRKFAADAVWRWKSEALDADQRRRHSDDGHRLRIVRQQRELDQDLSRPETIDGSAITTEQPTIEPGTRQDDELGASGG
jgi:hypothetical protein